MLKEKLLLLISILSIVLNFSCQSNNSEKSTSGNLVSNDSLFEQKPDRYYIDRLHSSLNFSLNYIEIMEFTGRADDFYGEFYFDPEKLENCRINLIVNARSMNTAMQNRDKDLHSPDYMDTEKYPVITFKSDNIIKRGSDLFAKGTLTIKEKPFPIELPFEITAKRDDSIRRLMVINAGPITIERSIFGIGKTEKNSLGKIFLGDKVKIWADILFKSESDDEKLLRKENNETSLEIAKLDELVGKFETTKGTQWSINRYDNKLFLILESAGIFYGMTPVGDNTFLVNDIGSMLRFNRTQNGKVTGLSFKIEEEESKWIKMKKISN